jgi:hypothetical protein
VVNDKLGVEIKAGDYIAYGSRDGNYGKITLALVLDVKMKKPDYGSQWLPVIGVAVVGDKDKPKKTWFGMPQQAIVLHPDGVPQKYKEILGG